MSWVFWPESLWHEFGGKLQSPPGGPGTRVPSPEVLSGALYRIALGGWELATYCDHVEHNEPADPHAVAETGATLRGIAVEIGRASGLDVVDAYLARLRQIEEQHTLRPSGPLALPQLRNFTMRDLQIIQMNHDRLFHPDVFGMSRMDQLRHYALHVAKLVGSVARLVKDESFWPDFSRRRLPDMFLFGIKLATVANQVLDETSETYLSSPGNEAFG